jgi:hypothetical protein
VPPPLAERDDQTPWVVAQLARRDLDFSGAYVLAGRVRDFLLKRPEMTSAPLVDGLVVALGRPRYEGQSQSFQYYSALAESLADVIGGPVDRCLAASAVSALTALSLYGKGNRARAAAEALGSLPLPIRGRGLPAENHGPVPTVAWAELAGRGGGRSGRPVMVGRSLVTDLTAGGGHLVVKLVWDKAAVAGLVAESRWMVRLEKRRFSVPFDLPRPLKIRGGYACRLVRPPVLPEGGATWGKKRVYGIAFVAPPGYFDYPNDHRPDHRLSDDRFGRLLFRSARLLGELTGAGIVHTAPIPLFHNRIQRGRRADAGLYHWWRGGRLDRWLHSSRYPNFGGSGLRDFEHLAPMAAGGKGLYRAIGGQLLSLILVAGSHFRHKAPDRFGIEADGRPVDVRSLFDTGLFAGLIRGSAEAFYRGFAGKRAPRLKIPDTECLAGQLVAAMGVDRHMTEILRVTDQQRMDDAAFAAFLTAHGRTPAQILATPRSAADIHLNTGPHLGGFNGRISVPELTGFLAATAAGCVAGRYCADAGLPMDRHHVSRDNGEGLATIAETGKP